MNKIKLPFKLSKAEIALVDSAVENLREMVADNVADWKDKKFAATRIKYAAAQTILDEIDTNY